MRRTVEPRQATMDELRDVITHLLRLAGPQGVGRTMLVKLVYFSELESWRQGGQPLTSASFYRFHYGAWAPDVTEVAEDLPWIDRKWHIHFYRSRNYTLRDSAPSVELSERALDILNRVFQTYSRMTAAAVGSLSKQTEPMLAVTETGQALDLSMVAPKTWTLESAELSDAIGEFDFSIRGSSEEIAARDRDVLGIWGPLRDRAMH